MFPPLRMPFQVLVNCAGTSIAGAFDELEVEQFERMYKVNVLGTVYPTRVVLPLMKAQKEGRIVFVSSMAGLVSLTTNFFLYMIKFGDGIETENVLNNSVNKQVLGKVIAYNVMH